jgi:hypothetical protein
MAGLWLALPWASRKCNGPLLKGIKPWFDGV